MDEDNLSAEYKDEVLVSILKRRIITLLAAFDDLNLVDDNAIQPMIIFLTGSCLYNYLKNF